MTKPEFLNLLEAGLAHVSTEERVAAIQFYSEYIDEAGPENEQTVLTELGSPEQLAQDIAALNDTTAATVGTLQTNTTAPIVAQDPPAPSDPFASSASAHQAYTTAANTSRPPLPYALPGGYVPPSYTAPAGNTNAQGSTPPPMYTQRPTSNTGRFTWMQYLAMGMLILFSPAILGLFIAGLILCLVPFIIFFAFLFATFVVLWEASLLFSVSPANGLLILGVALLILAVAALAFWGGVKLFTKAIPAVIRGCKQLWHSISTKGGSTI